MIVYTLAELRDGTGFARGARFVREEDAAILLSTLQELYETAYIYTDINAGRGAEIMRHTCALLESFEAQKARKLTCRT